jgi:hypothetical protein
MTSSIVITPTTSSLDGNSGMGAFSTSKMQNEQPLCRFLKAGGVEGGLFLICWPPSFLVAAVWLSSESKAAFLFGIAEVEPTSLSPGNNQSKGYFNAINQASYRSEECLIHLAVWIMIESYKAVGEVLSVAKWRVSSLNNGKRM